MSSQSRLHIAFSSNSPQLFACKACARLHHTFVAIMQRCLDIEELQVLICAELKKVRSDGVEEPDRRALRSLALTAKTFLSPALNLLWRQNDLKHLFKLLPSTLWDNDYPDDETFQEEKTWGVPQVRFRPRIVFGFRRLMDISGHEEVTPSRRSPKVSILQRKNQESEHKFIAHAEPWLPRHCTPCVRCSLSGRKLSP